MIEFAINQLSGSKIKDQDVKQWLQDVKKILKLKPDYNISIAIVGDAAMKKLNQAYRGKNKVTDVLSFGEFDSSVKKYFSNDDYLGEVVICHPQAVRQAKKAKHSVKREFQTLLVHGVMHLLGYDHEEDKEAEAMESLEKKILTSL